jgi:hypothetical protein
MLYFNKIQLIVKDDMTMRKLWKSLFTAAFLCTGFLTACSSAITLSSTPDSNNKTVTQKNFHYNPSETLSEDEIVAELEYLKKVNQ